MKILLQRVASARVVVAGEEVAAIGCGLLLFVGIEKGDEASACPAAAAKVALLRVFPDAAGRMNLALGDVSGAALVVSQFTLAGSLTRGRRPSFESAAPPDLARELVDRFASELSALGIPTRQGVFGADMAVHLVNDGPVTFLIDLPPATGEPPALK